MILLKNFEERRKCKQECMYADFLVNGSKLFSNWNFKLQGLITSYMVNTKRNKMSLKIKWVSGREKETET